MIVDSWGRVRLVLLYRTFAGIVTVRFNNGVLADGYAKRITQCYVAMITSAAPGNC
ncbi:hypothetical protein C206_05859 [Pseudomonas putida TRO1]|uniref:Uncharacterized protein n=1 Tax=Pseudomonas putida TRO1 TaxID=1227924 RepID=A0AAD2ZYN1_PSEPU|nr:hypothetical protein PPUTLS46_016034 [Pseudomonas putida LS46]ENY78603.1 hypothetical protein C206_05859 [Pseudomonas putida TRO1]